MVFWTIFYVFSKLWAADPLLSSIMIHASMEGGMCFGTVSQKKGSQSSFFAIFSIKLVKSFNLEGRYC